MMEMLRKGYPVTNVYLFKNKLWLKEFSTRMHDWLKGNKRPPIKIDAELHRRCNLNCRFCSRRENDKDMTEESKEIEVSKDRWIEIAKQSGEMGVKAWNISGIGEPMCKPDLTLSVMEKLKEYGIFGEITTNGTLWDEERVKKVVEMGWDSVCVSLDSPERETHNYLRRSEAFDKAVETLQSFKKWREKLNKSKPAITINAVLNKKNYLQIPKLFLFGKDLGVDSIFVEPMIVYTELGEELKLEKEEIKEFKKIAERCKEIGKKFGVEPNINCFTEDKNFQEDLVDKTSDMKEVIKEDSETRKENYKNPDKHYHTLTEKILDIPCYYPWFYMIIAADGSASHCGEKIEKKENIKESDLEKIWYGDEFERDREKFIRGDLPDYCDRCRPNVIGDARRIRKSIIELRDKKYLLNAISEAEYLNKNLEEKIEILKNSDEKEFENCGENCRHKEELESLKGSYLYKLLSGITNTSFGESFKRNIHSLINSELKNNLEREEKTNRGLREELFEKVMENKRLKNKLYALKKEKDIYKNLEGICEHKRELIEIKKSLLYKIVS